MPEEKAEMVTMLGKPVTLLGPRLKPGDNAPDFNLLDNKLNSVTLADSTGKIRLISVVSSLDTEVCDIQTRMFSKAVRQLGDDIIFFTVSMDLPFAQNRWISTMAILG